MENRVGNRVENRAEKSLLSFQVITDTHIVTDMEHEHNRNLDRALKDIAAHAPESCGIMHAGDVTDNGELEEYETFKQIWDRNKAGLPPLYATSGNHDICDDWQRCIPLFLSQTGMTGMYHDHWIGGYHFIFLGTEEGIGLFCTLSDEQLTWLDAKLGEEAATDKPVFIFLHQPLKDTVAGSLEAQNWYGVTQDEELKAVLKKHRQAILFTGHTHWELGAPHTYFDGGGTLPAMFNAASAAYLWTDEDEHKDGSQGFYVDVYADRVLVRGRDFERSEWVEGAEFEVRL
ncbi:3',5'-cyclic AMP phosphodiesterase CpdA [Paenibacillus taihuensis]|uniref:3',5'-cyclic AMP phosphodiesterase CpdA n=1 Tax=Paenibacillus taihuensis TaxID=1156355 RepID=A0A3D9S1N9_9BACL|nr:metallophosphoesterase [Paenibacillus taihuensis]REE86520.1 3',5'-cyclic AMP phosphodiesterase CpdA [Paenibacillus taihuensis]